MKIQDIDDSIIKQFKKGVVIPAMPLALNENRKFDKRRQQALTRYYIDAGAGGVAVGVHTTQFAIRQEGIFEEVIASVSEAADDWCKKTEKKIIKIAGVCGKTSQAIAETQCAIETGYHAALLNLSDFKTASMANIITHCANIAEIIPVVGFYLQTAAGGIELPYSFWREFVKIPNILGIKIAPFNRYKTLDVVRALCETDKENDITLYTGNDDNIVIDLLTEYKIISGKQEKKVRIKGGLLGHWSVWTQKAVALLDEIHRITQNQEAISPTLLSKNVEITDSNAAFFDATNNFSGCIPGLHEVLRRQGLLEGVWCLDKQETLSAGQADEITRVYNAYPHLNDDEFIRTHLKQWLSGEN